MSQISSIGYSSSYMSMSMDLSSVGGTSSPADTGALLSTDQAGGDMLSVDSLLSGDGGAVGATGGSDIQQMLEMMVLLLVLSVLTGDQGGDDMMQSLVDMMDMLSGSDGEQATMTMSMEANFSLTYASDGAAVMPQTTGATLDAMA